MTHATRFVAVAVLVALALCVPVQAQTPENDALRARAEAGDAEAQAILGVMYDTGEGVVQDYVQSHMWRNLVASRETGEDRELSVKARDAVASFMTAAQLAEAQRLAREWTAAHPREVGEESC